jgi:C4-dicarboxylate transporter
MNDTLRAIIAGFVILTGLLIFEIPDTTWRIIVIVVLAIFITTVIEDLRKPYRLSRMDAIRWFYREMSTPSGLIFLTTAVVALVAIHLFRAWALAT